LHGRNGPFVVRLCAAHDLNRHGTFDVRAMVARFERTRVHITPQPYREHKSRPFIVLALASLGGLLAFLYPFVIPGITQVTDDAAAHTGTAPLLFAGVTIACLVAMLVTISDEQAGV